MALKGGARPGAGRPVGARSKIPKEYRERAQALLRKHGPKIEATLFASPDHRVLLGLYQTLLSYGYGRPSQAIAVSHSAPSVERILQQLAERRLGRAQQPLLPAAGETEGREP